MKIIELIIDELDKISGFDAVALVESPAIESDFYAFKKEDLTYSNLRVNKAFFQRSIR